MQNIDIDDVASKRRNPIIADIFSRMHFMERRGSGFKKIKADYRQAVNYHSEVEPLFKSTPTSFFVTLFNLNYNVSPDNLDELELKTGLRDQKQALDEPKTGLHDKKQAFDENLAALNFSAPTKNNIKKVFYRFGFDTAFSRSDIMIVTGLTATPATELMRKMKNNGLIVSVEGRGNYMFLKSQD